MPSQSQLTQLAALLTSSLAILQEEWKAANIPEPSLDPTSPDPPAFISVKADKASRTVLGAAKLLTTLVQGPYRTSTWQVQEVLPPPDSPKVKNGSYMRCHAWMFFLNLA